jgi:hypothetical protein
MSSDNQSTPLGAPRLLRAQSLMTLRDCGRVVGSYLQSLDTLAAIRHEARFSGTPHPQRIRTFVGLVALALVAGSNTPAFAAVSVPARDQTMLIGTDVATPLPGLRFETSSEPKVLVIRVAPHCASCDEDFG